ncbi:MAG: phosphoglycerate mutase family protein [Bdellovibrionia bacterium]
MKFYIFRHAEKSSGGGPNPSLSAGGFDQASKLALLVREGKLPSPQELWVSPKIRTHQTFAPLAEHLGISLKEIPELIEKQSSESLPEFRQRIESVLQEVVATKKCIFVCTHMDWAEEAMSLIPCDKDLSGSEFSYWSPAQYVGFQLDKSLFHFLETGAV